MVEITQYALNQRSPTEGKGNVQKLSGKPPHALKGQKLLAQGIRPGCLWTQNCRPVRAKAFKEPSNKQSFYPYRASC